MLVVKINGRNQYFYSLDKVKRVRRGRWEAHHRGTDETYIIEGGRAAGGTRRDWFVSHPSWRKVVTATSLVDALNILENM